MIYFTKIGSNMGIHGYFTKPKNSRDGKPDLKKHELRGHDCLEEWNEFKKINGFEQKEWDLFLILQFIVCNRLLFVKLA